MYYKTVIIRHVRIGCYHPKVSSGYVCYICSKEECRKADRIIGLHGVLLYSNLAKATLAPMCTVHLYLTG